MTLLIDPFFVTYRGRICKMKTNVKVFFTCLYFYIYIIVKMGLSKYLISQNAERNNGETNGEFMDKSWMFEAITFHKYLKDHDYVLIPINIDHNHWVLLVHFEVSYLKYSKHIKLINSATAECIKIKITSQMSNAVWSHKDVCFAGYRYNSLGFYPFWYSSQWLHSSNLHHTTGVIIF